MTEIYLYLKPRAIHARWPAYLCILHCRNQTVPEESYNIGNTVPPVQSHMCSKLCIVETEALTCVCLLSPSRAMLTPLPVTTRMFTCDMPRLGYHTETAVPLLYCRLPFRSAGRIVT